MHKTHRSIQQVHLSIHTHKSTDCVHQVREQRNVSAAAEFDPLTSIFDNPGSELAVVTVDLDPLAFTVYRYTLVVGRGHDCYLSTEAILNMNNVSYAYTTKHQTLLYRQSGPVSLPRCHHRTPYLPTTTQSMSVSLLLYTFEERPCYYSGSCVFQ